MLAALKFMELPAETQTIPEMLNGGEFIGATKVERNYTVKSVPQPGWAARHACFQRTIATGITCDDT